MYKDKVKHDFKEIETINIELDHRVTKLIAENEHLKIYLQATFMTRLNSSIQSKENVCRKLLYQCVLDFINNVNAHAKSRSVKKNSKKKVWKPTRKVFTNIGYFWRPTGRTFTIVGNACPLTRITITTEVPLRKPIALDNDTPKPTVTLVYSRKTRKSKTNVPVSNPRIFQSVSANKKKPSKSWGSINSDVPSSSLDACRSFKLSSSIWTPAAPSI
ncbi:hypothetical protein Tco_0818435 [Tanacetum coccineum]